jgi:hypothetical protein
MGFGTSYSLIYVDCLDWVHTGLFKRIARGFLGCLIIYGLFYGLHSIPCFDNPTRYFFHYALPALGLSLFIFGLYPILCQNIGLVDSDSSPKTERVPTELEVQIEKEERASQKISKEITI